MRSNPELDGILSEVRRDHRATDAPASLEPVLRAAAEGRKAVPAGGRPGFKWSWAAVTALLLAFGIAGGVWQLRTRHQSTDQQVQSAPVPQVRVEVVVPSKSATQKQSATASSKREAGAVRSRAPELAASPTQQRWNALDEFVPLPVSEGLAPASDLSVVRIKVRGSDLQQYGLDAPGDAATQMMLAEFVVGEDGLPRAIRIVR